MSLPDDSWSAFEIKLGNDPVVVEAAADGLLRFADRVTDNKPTSLSVVASSGPSYRRPDGVNVIAIETLEP